MFIYEIIVLRFNCFFSRIQLRSVQLLVQEVRMRCFWAAKKTENLIVSQLD